MLNTVPEQMNKMARSVTMNHPNSMDCDVYRKLVLRTSTGEVGGMPKLGGMAVLDSEDEPDVTWEYRGAGKLLMVDQYQLAPMVNLDDAVDASSPSMYAMVEFTELPSDGDLDKKQLNKHDVVMILITDDVEIAFEVMDVQGAVNIPPYSRRYLLEKRDDLTYINGFRD